MSFRKKTLAYLAILSAVVIWGFSFISIRVCVAEIPPITLALYRFLIALVLLTAVFFGMGSWHRKVEKKDWVRLVLGGITGIGLYFVFENYGVMWTNASIASLMIASIPVLSFLAEALFFRAEKSPWKLAGVAVTLIGVVLLVQYRGTLPADGKTVAGYVFMFLTAVMWVVYNFITRPLYEKYHSLSVTFYQTLFGAAVLVLFSIPELPAWQVWKPISLPVFGNLMFLAVFCSAIAYLLYIYALGVLGVLVTSIFINLIPVVTVIAGYALLGERIGLLQAAGGVLVILAVFLTTHNSGRKPVKS